jgi:hypothetical protein
MLPVHRVSVLALLTVGFLTLPLRAADQKDIDKAVAAGVAHLKSIQGNDGTWNYGHNDGSAGATALAGLTLLECDVAADDPAVRAAAAVIRRLSAGTATTAPMDQTYALSLSILFLDRLGDPDDVPLIESMTVRLLAGQNNTGGWSYKCPNDLGVAEMKRLGEVVKKQEDKPPPKKRELTKPEDDDKPLRDKKGPAKRDPSMLPKEIKAQLEFINVGLAKQAPGFAQGGMGDNSNTQFAILALWVSRRHGMPVDKALARIDARFRLSQNADGGWGYMSTPGAAEFHMGRMGGSSPAMTCAGLLGLAAGHGVAAEAVLKAADPKDKDKEKDKDQETRRDTPKKEATPRDPNKDAAVKAGLQALGSVIGEPLAKGERRQLPAPGGLNPIGNKTYYFLWSLERVAVAFGLDTIGNKDWYAWGSDVALLTQQKDGSWAGEYGQGGVDTSFALLFLRRANLASDLTDTLKGKVTDPGRVVLKAGVGIGDTKPDPKDEPKSKPDARDKPPTETKPSSDLVKAKPISPKPPDAKTEADRLAAELVQANPAKQERLLNSLRDSKGADHTQALLTAIPKLEGDIKKKAREALAERMARMTSATLEVRMKDDDPEMRRAAALACAMKEETEHVPRLIELLDDPETSVSRAAYAALKSLSNKDFGPVKDASRAERDKAIAAWKAWWKEKGAK